MKFMELLPSTSRYRHSIIVEKASDFRATNIAGNPSVNLISAKIEAHLFFRNHKKMLPILVAVLLFAAAVTLILLDNLSDDFWMIFG